NALRPAHDPGAEHHAGAAQFTGLSPDPDPAYRVFAARFTSSLLRSEHPVDHARRRTKLEADQSGPHEEDLGGTCNSWHFPSGAHSAAQAARRNLLARPIAAGHQPDLGWHRRRLDLAYDRWRCALEQHHAAADVSLAKGFRHRSEPLRS